MVSATLLHFNVSGGEGLDEQLRCWIENKLSSAGVEVQDCPLDGAALLCGEDDATLTELDALLGAEQVFPSWLQRLRDGGKLVQQLKDPTNILLKIQQAMKKHLQYMEGKVEDELRAREEDFATGAAECSRRSDEFKLLLATREIRLPAPLDLSRLSTWKAGTAWTVATSDLDTSAKGITSSEMQQHLRENHGVQLIVVEKAVAKEAAYMQYPFIANSKLPLIGWAKIPASKSIRAVAHLAVLVDESLNKTLYDQLLELQEPSSKDLAAMLNVVITTNLSGISAKCISMRLNISQAHLQMSQSVKVTVLDHSNSTYTVRQLFNDVNSQLSTERCVLAPEPHLTLEGMQAEEGLPEKPMAPRVLSDASEDVAQLLEGFLVGAEQKLWGWPEEGSVPVLRMEVSIPVVPALQPLKPQLEPLKLDIEHVAEDDGILPNQQVIAQELLSRVLIMTGMTEHSQNGADWFEQSCKKLAQRFPDGMQFVVVMPAFQTLRQQTFDRIVKAKLANATDSGIVIPTIWSAKGDFKAFYDSAVSNTDKLFVMIVDECHYGATFGQAHDTYVNDNDSLQRTGQAKLLQQDNFLTLLVSATPYSMLTNSSRIPNSLFVPCELSSKQQALAEKSGLSPLDVLSKQGATWQISSSYPSRGTQSSHKLIDADHIKGLVKDQVLVELHTLDWNSADTQKVPYRRIEDYVMSMNKPKADQHGVVHDTQFDLKFQEARKQQGGCLTDHVLLIDYLLALQYFRLFRWDCDHHCLLDVNSDTCKQRILSSELVQDYILELRDVLPHSLFLLAIHLLEFQTTRKWLQDDLEHRADLPDLAASDLSIPGLRIAVHKLQLLLLNKLEDEQGRNCYLGSIADEERNDVYNETDRIVHSLLDVKLDAGKTVQDPSAKSTGNMVVLRVTTAKVGDEIKNILNRLLDYTASKTLKWKDGNGWQLFDVIGDFGFGEHKRLTDKISPWSMKRALSSSHPARLEPEHKAALEAEDADATGSGASLQYLARLKAKLSGSKAATLQYSDLHGVPCLLVLCEKGRMGDTFPQTFCCLDLRIRTSDNHTTFIQEMGRLCRYPACSTSDDCHAIPIQADSDGHISLQDRLACLRKVLKFAYSGGRNAVHEDWQSCATAISTALHLDVAELIKLLNSIATSTTPIFLDPTSSFLDMSHRVETVLSLPGVAFAKDGADSLSTILKVDLKWVNDERQFASRWESRVLRKQLPQVRKAIMQWRDSVVNQWEATGYRHDDANASCLVEQRPVRLHINGGFVADALDSADLACILLHPAGSATISQAITAAGGHQLKISRYSHKLPYVLVKKATKAALMEAHQRTKGRIFGEANHEMWAEEVVQNLPMASKLDRYMQRSTKGKLQGSAIHEYRSKFKPTSDSYDYDNKEFHWRRLLLKAEPQSGKTGAYLGLLLQLKRLLEPGYCPVPAVLPTLDSTTKPHDVYGRPEAELRWRHPFFTDIKNSEFPKYHQVLASKYAEKVVLQRAMLLAKCLASDGTGTEWRTRYESIVLSPQGEYIQTASGRELLLNSISQVSPAPALWTPAHKQLVVLNDVDFEQVRNWDGRLTAVTGTMLNRQEASLDFAAGLISIETVKGKRTFRFKDQKVGSYIDAGSADAWVGNQAPVTGYHSIVQDLAWPSPQDESPLIMPAQMNQRPGSPWFQEELLAHTLQYRQMLQPSMKAAQLQGVKLECRNIEGKHAWATDKIFDSGGPVLWAPAHVWEALEQQDLLKSGSSLDSVRVSEAERGSISWVFVPTFNRYHAKPDKQILLDWADAMPQDHPYIRFVVIRPLPAEEQGYKQLLQAYYAQQSDSFTQLRQHTILLVLPPTVKLAFVPSSDKRDIVGHELGVGYARLAVQLIACWMRLHRVWLMDDNVQECYRLDYQHMLQHHKHTALQRVSFGEVMKTVESQFQHCSWDDVDPVQLQAGMDKHAKPCKPSLNSPRARHFQGEVKVEKLEDFTGDWTCYAMIGISKSIQRCYQVGMQWGPAPWKATHSIYSMFLLNVVRTVAAQAYWPAKPYHDDIDFPRICEEKQLVAAKCQWLFLHKALMQAPKVCGDTEDARRTPACSLLHPAGKTLSVGQLVVIRVPAALGAPGTLQLSEEHTFAGSAILTAIPAAAGNEQAEQTFVACWQADCPELSGARLQVTFDGQLQEVQSQQEHTGEVKWSSCGLFKWGDSTFDTESEAQAYAPSISSAASQFWQEQRQLSSSTQLQSILRAVQSTHLSQQLWVTDPLCMYHTFNEPFFKDLGFLNYKDGQDELKAKPQSILFYANDNNAGRLSAVLQTILTMLKRAGVRGGLNHVIVVPCWDDWNWSTSQVFSDCKAALHGKLHGKLTAVYSTAPAAQCRMKLTSSGSEDTHSDSDTEQPFSQDVIALRPHLVIGFSFGKRPRSSDVSGNVPQVSEVSFSAAAGGGDAAPMPLSPSSTIASPGSRLPSIQEQDSNMADLTGESKPSQKKPRREWSQWMEDVLRMQDEHLPHWVVARNCKDQHGISVKEAAKHVWTAGKSDTFRTVTFSSSSHKLDKHAPKLIGLKSWYDGTGSQGDKAQLLEQSLFMKTVTNTTNADELTAALNQAFPSCTSVIVYVFPYVEGEARTATGYAQICFRSPESKDAARAGMQGSQPCIWLTPVPSAI